VDVDRFGGGEGVERGRAHFQASQLAVNRIRITVDFALDEISRSATVEPIAARSLPSGEPSR